MLQAGRDLSRYLVLPADLTEHAAEVVSWKMVSPKLHSRLAGLGAMLSIKGS